MQEHFVGKTSILPSEVYRMDSEILNVLSQVPTDAYESRFPQSYIITASPLPVSCHQQSVNGVCRGSYHAHPLCTWIAPLPFWRRVPWSRTTLETRPVTTFGLVHILRVNRSPLQLIFRLAIVFLQIIDDFFEAFVIAWPS
jgi:hypothetical protein